MKKQNVHINNLGIKETVKFDKNIPSDYHCDCKYCTTNFLGNIYDTDSGKGYSNRIRQVNYIKNKHIAEGHVIGYRWLIQNYTSEGDYVFDPTAGTATTVVESINLGRNGIGIELEYPKSGFANIENQKNPTGKSYFRQGDARNFKKYFKEWNLPSEPFLDLIVTGTPYPVMGNSNISSDSPERPININYENEYSIGRMKLKKGYYQFISNLYKENIDYLKVGKKFCIIIKDLLHNKKNYLLHKHILDNLMQIDDRLEIFGSFIHKHLPKTLFMNTYNKRFPDVKIPLYQTGIILEKKSK